MSCFEWYSKGPQKGHISAERKQRPHLRPSVNSLSAAGQARPCVSTTQHGHLRAQEPSDVSTRCCPLNHSYIIRLTSGRNGYDYIKAMTFTSDEDSSLMAKQWNSEMT